MKYAYLFLIILCISSCFNSSQDETFLVQNLISTGEYKYDIIKPKENPELLDLISKIQSSANKNLNWFINYSENESNRDENNKLKYSDKFGLSEAELDRMMTLFDEITYQVIDSSSVFVTNDNGFISFFHNDPYDILNFLKVNSNQNIAIFDSTYLAFNKHAIIEDDNNAFRSGWEGVSWKFIEEDSVTPLTLDLEVIKTLNHSSIEVNLGKLFKNERVFLLITIKEIHNGKIEKYQHQIIFNKKNP